MSHRVLLEDPDPARSAAFAGEMLETLNRAALALMTSIGHRTGLFDAMAGLPPSTSEEIAATAGMNERYVREWLAAMATGGVVEYAPQRGTYHLPAEHAASLTRAAGSNNAALGAQYIALLGQVEDRVVECFRSGGGVPYSAFPRFQRLMAEDSATVQDATLIDVALPLVPGLTRRLEEGIDVCDVGCGSGHAVNLMARAFPRSRFVGFDLSAEGIEAARSESAAASLGNARFELRDVAHLDLRERFDLITAFDAIHDQARPAAVLQGIAAALRPDGVFLMVDIRASSRLEENRDHFLGTFMYTVSCMHCMTVSLAEGGAGLGAMWGEQKAREMLADAGFTSVTVEQVEGDPFNNYYVATKTS